MFIIIIIFSFLLSPALAQARESKCLGMTRENFLLRHENIIVDMTSYTTQSRGNQGHGVSMLYNQIKISTSMLTVWKNFSLFYSPTSEYRYLNTWEDDFTFLYNDDKDPIRISSRKESENIGILGPGDFRGVFNSTAFADITLASVSSNMLSGLGSLNTWTGKNKFSTKASNSTLKSLLYNSNTPISQVVLEEIKFTKNFQFGTETKMGYISPLVTVGNESICDSNEDELLKLLKLINQIFIGPLHCQNISSVEKCVKEVVRIVEHCGDQVKTKMSKLNHSTELLPIGIVTTTAFFGDDYLSRGKYWCFISEYAEKTERQVIMMDDDDFFRHYAQKSLKWDVPENGTSFEGKETMNIFTTPIFISGGVAVAAIILFIIVLRYIRKHKGLISKRDANEFFNGRRNESGWLGLSYNRDLEIAKDDIFLDADNILGSGAFGCVYGSHISVNGLRQEVAIKTMKKSSECETTLKGLCSEIKVLSHLGTHEHIVCLVGAYTAELEKGIVYVIMEMCSRGSLERYLKLMKNPENDQYLILVEKDSTQGETTSRAESLETSDNDEEQLLVRFSREICSGMEYLAGKNVIHGDLATRNILLTSSLQAKISDFGLSRRLYEYTKYVKKEEEPIPWKWMAPEALTKLEFSEQSDVWSYGVTIWEIFSYGNTPYPGLGWRLDFPNQLENGLRLEIPENCSQHFYETMLMCWYIDPSERPTFSQLQERI